MDPRSFAHNQDRRFGRSDDRPRRGGPRWGEQGGAGDGRGGRRGRGGFGGRGGPFGPEGRGGPFGQAPFGRGPRRGRGEVRTAVLLLLRERPMHGYEMIQQIRERSNEAWSPSPGAIYPTIQMLTDEGLITTTETDGKKVSSLTETGRAAADELAESTATPWSDTDGSGERVAGLRVSTFALMGAIRQVGVVGTDAQRQQAVTWLDETRRKLYGLLASDES